MAKKVYLNFPISLIPPIYNDNDVYDAMESIINYGIASFWIGKKVDIAVALKEMGITCNKIQRN